MLQGQILIAVPASRDVTVNPLTAGLLQLFSLDTFQGTFRGKNISGEAVVVINAPKLLGAARYYCKYSLRACRSSQQMAAERLHSDGVLFRRQHIISLINSAHILKTGAAFATSLVSNYCGTSAILMCAQKVTIQSPC